MVGGNIMNGRLIGVVLLVFVMGLAGLAIYRLDHPAPTTTTSPMASEAATSATPTTQRPRLRLHWGGNPDNYGWDNLNPTPTAQTTEVLYRSAETGIWLKPGKGNRFELLGFIWYSHLITDENRILEINKVYRVEALYEAVWVQVFLFRLTADGKVQRGTPKWHPFPVGRATMRFFWVQPPSESHRFIFRTSAPPLFDPAEPGQQSRSGQFLR